MAGRWLMSTIKMAFSIQPAIVYWVAGRFAIRLGGRRSARSSPSRRSRRACCSRSSPALVGTDVEASLALFDRIFEYLDLPVDIVEATDPVELRPDELLGEVRLEGVGFRYGEDYPLDARTTSTSSCRPGTRTAIVGETGAGKTTLGYLVARLYEPQAGA